MRNEYDFSNGRRGPVIRDGVIHYGNHDFHDVKMLIRKKLEGEEVQKSFYNGPTVFMNNDVWIVTYCLENFTRTLAISRQDKAQFSWEDFYKEFPLFKKVFGLPIEHGVQEQSGKPRGYTACLQLNHFLKEPFFVTGVPEGETRMTEHEFRKRMRDKIRGELAFADAGTKTLGEVLEIIRAEPYVKSAERGSADHMQINVDFDLDWIAKNVR